MPEGEQARADPRDIGQPLAQQVGRVVAGDLRVGQRCIGRQAPVWCDIASQIGLDAAAAHLARGHVEVRVDRILRQHVVLRDVEGADAGHQARLAGFLPAFPFVAQLPGRTLQWFEGIAVHIAAGIGLERAPPRQEGGAFGAEHPGHAGTGCEFAVVVVAAGRAVAAHAVGALVKALHTQARHQLQLLRHVQLVLGVEGAGVVMIVGHDQGARVGRLCLAIDRGVDIDAERCGAQVRTADVGVMGIAAHLEAGQHRVPQGPGLQLAGGFGLQAGVAGGHGAPCHAPGQGSAVALQGAGFGAVAGVVRLAMHQAGPHAPLVVQGVVQRELVYIPPDVQVGDGRFTQIAVARQGVGTAIDDGQAAVVGGTDAGDVGLVVHDGTCRGRPGQGRCHDVLRGLDQAGAGGALFGHEVEPPGQGGGERAGGIEGGPAQTPVAHLQARLAHRPELRLFGDDVVGAAGFAAAVESSRRALEDFHPFDGVGIAPGAALAGARKAVDQRAGAGLEAPQGKAVPGAAVIVALRHAADEADDIGQPGGTQIPDQLLRDDADVLGDFDERRIGAAGRGVALLAGIAAGVPAGAHADFGQGGGFGALCRAGGQQRAGRDAQQGQRSVCVHDEDRQG